MTLRRQKQATSSGRWPTLVVLLLLLAFILVFGTLSLQRYRALESGVDLAIYSQVVWNTAHGDPFRTSALPFTENYLGNHFTPILALFAPIYLVWPDPRVLLLAQVIVAALSAGALYWFAREQLPTPWAGVLIVAALLFYPALQYQSVVDFHGIALGTTAVMWAFFALLTRRDLLLLALLPIMILIREDLALVIMMMGVYALLAQRRRWLGIGLFVLGLVLAALLILVVIPAFRDGQGFYYNEYYDYLGSSPLEIARTFLTEPGVWLRRVFFAPKLELLVQLLAPVAFLPLLAPSILILGASALAYMLLVDLPFQPIYTLGTQYQALFIPVVFFGTVLGLARLVAWLGPRWQARRVALVGSGLVALLCLVATLLSGPLTDEATRAEFREDEQSRAEWALLAQIPPDAGVVAGDRFSPALSTREGFSIFRGLFAYRHAIDYLIYDDTPVGYPVNPPALLDPPDAGGSWLVPRYELVDSAGLAELRRQAETITADPLPEPADFGGRIALRAATGGGGTLAGSPGQPLLVALVWEALAPDLPRLVPFLQLIERDGDAEYRWASVDREPYGGQFPTDRWHAGAQVGDVYGLLLPPWLAPGLYELRAGLYTRDGQQRLSLSNGATTALAGFVEVGAPGPLAEEELAGVPIVIDEVAAPGLALHGRTPIVEQAGTGTALDVTLFWRAMAPMSQDYQVRFDLAPAGEGGAGAQRDRATTWQGPIAGGRLPASDWQPGTVVADWHPLALPADLSPGGYDLFVTVVDGEQPAGPAIRLTTLQVE